MSDPRIEPLCDRWGRLDGQPQRRCGEPATHEHTNRRGITMFFCELCARTIRAETRDKIVPREIENHGTH